MPRKALSIHVRCCREGDVVMLFSFYIPALVALAGALGAVLEHRPVRALLNLVASLLAIAVVFYGLGAPFAAALEVIVYAGAVMVLFVFVVMMLNLPHEHSGKRSWKSPIIWGFPLCLAVMLFVCLSDLLLERGHVGLLLGNGQQAPEQVGLLLFGPYILLVELAAFLLLAALIVASHIGKRSDDIAASPILREPSFINEIVSQGQSEAEEVHSAARCEMKEEASS